MNPGSKYQFYSALAERTISELTAKRGNWTQFLDSAAWLYKYPFQDQMMIYAQRPDATACAELELWNEQFNRWVRRGAYRCITERTRGIIAFEIQKGRSFS